MKKILTITAALCLIATLAVGGSIAYLQDTDSAVNVMTLGNVDIEQHEQERGKNGELQKFSQAKPAYPAVGPIEWAETGVDVNGTEYKVFTPDLKNVVDKIVTVENTGKSDAFVRTIVAIEAPDYDAKNLIHVNVNADEKLDRTNWTPVDVDGRQYVYSVFTYEDALAPKTISAPSLMQVFLDSMTTNEDIEPYGDEWDIIVLSQAVQAQGFENAAAALDTAFGVPEEKSAEDETKTKVQVWLEAVESERPNVISSAEEAYEATLKDGRYVLGNNYNTSDTNKQYNGNRAYALQSKRQFGVDLNGHTVNFDMLYQDGKNTGYTYLYTITSNCKLTIDGNGTINAENPEGNTCVVYAQGTGEAEINGGDFNVVRGIPVWAGGTSHITINGGSFISSGATNEDMIYSSGGVIDIYGGFFHNTGWENRPVNVKNTARGTGFINIYGGTFVNADPSTGFDDPNNIKVMDGYKVVSETQANGDVWYTVVPE